MKKKLIFVAIKVEKNEVVDTIAFDDEGDCMAFCTQYPDWDSVPTPVSDLKHALMFSVS